jgi:hypothetical protein
LPEVDCHACEEPAINACKRCAKPYCGDHGNAHYCADCLQPASALPSFNLYRGALLAMLAGTALAVFFIVRPPGESGSASPAFVGNVITPTPQPSDGTAQPTRAAQTPQITNTPRPTSTPTVSPFDVYTIVDGDTLYDIAAAHLAPDGDLDAFAREIADVNGLDFDFPTLTPGETLNIPRPVP